MQLFPFVWHGTLWGSKDLSIRQRIDPINAEEESPQWPDIIFGTVQSITFVALVDHLQERKNHF